MRCTLSEPKFLNRIRELEGLGSDVTADEINHRLTHYAGRLFEHLRGFGINQVGFINSTGTLGTFYVGLDRCHDDESRNKRIEGLAMLDPLSVDLEQGDLPAFFVGGLLTTMVDSFDEYSSQFQRVTVSELSAGLLRIAEKLVFAPRPQAFQPVTEDDAVLLQGYEEEQFEQWCLRSGLKVPDRKSRAVEEHRRAEEAAEHARQEAAYEQFRRGNGE